MDLVGTKAYRARNPAHQRADALLRSVRWNIVHRRTAAVRLIKFVCRLTRQAKKRTRACDDQMHDMLIEAWHEGPGDKTLAQFLRMTDEEYRSVVENHENLYQIMARRRAESLAARESNSSRAVSA